MPRKGTTPHLICPLGEQDDLAMKRCCVCAFLDRTPPLKFSVFTFSSPLNFQARGATGHCQPLKTFAIGAIPS
jgi:hypothetical protein